MTPTPIAHGKGPLAGKLFLDHGAQPSSGRSVLASRRWYQVAFIRTKDRVEVFVDGDVRPEVAGALSALDVPAAFTLGKRLQGKLDEVAIFDRALETEELRRLWRRPE